MNTNPNIFRPVTSTGTRTGPGGRTPEPNSSARIHQVAGALGEVEADSVQTSEHRTTGPVDPSKNGLAAFAFEMDPHTLESQN